MKISVSVPAADVEFLDSYARRHGVGSRSAAVHHALRLLQADELGDAYQSAWQEWSASDDAAAWEPAAADGLPP